MTILIKDQATLSATIAAWRSAGDTIAFVPTMGALHAGHIALVKQAQQTAQRVITSIFVNPTQFGPNEDFTRYPRQMEQDHALLKEAGCAALFAPEVSTIYPAGFSTTINPGALATVIEGACRPGHFSGVATVVTRLLMLVQPDAAYFGEKDYQQLLVIQQTVRDLALPVQIIGVPTVRAPDGLALSSRNAYLSAAERERALILPATLRLIATEAPNGSDISTLLASGRTAIIDAGFSPDYLVVCDAATLDPITTLSAPARVLVAAKIGKTRLIDNMAVLPATKNECH